MHFIASLREPVTEKTNSYKALAQITQRLSGDSLIPFNATTILYFQKKTTTAQVLYYGDKIVFANHCNSASPENPGSFNYKSWCSHQGIFIRSTYQKTTSGNFQNKPDPHLKINVHTPRFHCKYSSTIHPRLQESGLCQALLIGYKDDLDKSLLQSYSNTGVIHVIAVSGLHLGLIYMLLSLICKPLGNKKMDSRIPSHLHHHRPLGLRVFLAGGSPSIFRSALMFTCVTIGDSLSKQASIFNSLAASAFLLICYNPYWLWDAGFQLSYTAVASLRIVPANCLQFHQSFLNDGSMQSGNSPPPPSPRRYSLLPVILFLFHQFRFSFLLPISLPSRSPA